MSLGATWGRALALAAALMCLAALTAPAAAAAEGYGIESMKADDWKGMWGFQKRGFAECWLAGKRHQAARTASDLTRLQPQLPPESPAGREVRAMQAELRTILNCHVTPQQLETGVDRFYNQPGNAKVLLGDALHLVIMETCGGAGRKCK